MGLRPVGPRSVCASARGRDNGAPEARLCARRSRRVWSLSMTDLTPSNVQAYTPAEIMVVVAARALAGVRTVFVGVGLPNLACNVARSTVAPELELLYESGVYGAQPARQPLSIGDPTLVTGAPSVISMADLFGLYLQGGLIRGSANRSLWEPEHHGDRQLYRAEGALAGQRRCLRDCHQRPACLHHHAPQTAGFCRTARLPDQSRPPAGGHHRPAARDTGQGAATGDHRQGAL